MIKCIYFVMAFLLFGCIERMPVKEFEQIFVNPSGKGEIIEKTHVRGSILELYLRDKDDEVGNVTVLNHHYILDVIETGQYLEKVENSIKCSIKKKDSIFYFDCVDMKKAPIGMKDSLPNVSRWDRKIINKWLHVEQGK